MVKLIRRDGETVTAYEDTVALNHGFSGQTGTVKHVANQFDLEYSVNQIIVKSGIGVVQGRQFSLSDQEVINLTPIVGSLYQDYVVYIEVDMAAIITDGDNTLNGNAEVKASPQVNFPPSDNLITYPSGIGYLPLWKFRHTSAGPTLIEDHRNVFNANEYKRDIPLHTATYEYANTKYVKSMIDDVKNITSGSIMSADGSTALGTVRRQVNFVICNAPLQYISIGNGTNVVIAKLPIGFWPTSQRNILIAAAGTATQLPVPLDYALSVNIGTDGVMVAPSISTGISIYAFKFDFGFEV